MYVLHGIAGYTTAPLLYRLYQYTVQYPAINGYRKSHSHEPPHLTCTYIRKKDVHLLILLSRVNVSPPPTLRTRVKNTKKTVVVPEKRVHGDPPSPPPRHFMSRRVWAILRDLLPAFLFVVALRTAPTHALGSVTDDNSFNVTDANDPNKTLTISNVKSNADMARIEERWGHVEILGSGKEYEFIKALFGGPLSCSPQSMVVADPIDACSNVQLSNLQGKILYTQRGGCTFSDKAWFAQNAGASGVIIGNSDQSILRMPEGYHTVSSPEAASTPIEIPVVMVRSSAGRAIEKIARRFGGIVPSVAIVAKRWTSQGTYLSGSCKSVFQESASKATSKTNQNGDENGIKYLTLSDVEMISSDGGRIHLVADEKGRSFEYLRGRFGGPPPRAPTKLVVADPIDACTSSQRRKVKMAAESATLIVRRGGCPFTQKAKVAENMGASAIVIVNKPEQPLQEMADGGLDEDTVTIYPIMTTYESGEELIAAATDRTNPHCRFSTSNFGVGVMWGSIERATNLPVSGWGETLEARLEIYKSLKALHDPASEGKTGSRERMAIVDKMFQSLPPVSKKKVEL